MFEDLRNTGDDHFCASSGLIPENSPLINLEGADEGGDSEDISSEEEEEVPPPSKGNGKRSAGGGNEKGKRPKTSGGQWMQDQVSKIVSFHERSACSVESMAARKEDKGPTIKEVMSIVKECGAAPGTKEFFIASELFTKRAEREMFMTLDTPQERFEWLSMKHFVKYNH